MSEQKLREVMKCLLALHDNRVDTADAWDKTMQEAREALAERCAPNQNDEGLLPCPFCGSCEVSRSAGKKGDGSPWPYIECHQCAASAEPGVWNSRASQSKVGK